MALLPNHSFLKPWTQKLNIRFLKKHTHPNIAYESVDVNLNSPDDNGANQKAETEKEDTTDSDDFYMPLHSLEAGMIIISPVHFINDDLVLDAGVILTEDIISHLITMHGKIKNKNFLVTKS